MKQRHFIDAHKALTGLFVLALMAYYGERGAWSNPVAWLYLGLHGTYGVLWLMKSRFFGDRQWEQPCRPERAAAIWVGLSLYWVGPWLIASGRSPTPPPHYLGLCVAIYALGVFFHFSADMQKHMHLALRPGTLLTEGLWGLSRNPNYFGELLIYLGFTLLARHPAPLLVLLLFIVVEWLPNMRRKDRSLSRYPEFGEYQARTAFFIPFVY